MRRILYCAVFLAIVLWSVAPVLAGPNREVVARGQDSRMQQSDGAGQVQQSNQGQEIQQSDQTGQLQQSDQTGELQQFDQDGKPVDRRAIRPYMSVREKVMVQREIQQRAAASRNALMRQAQMEREAERRKAEKTTQQTVK